MHCNVRLYTLFCEIMNRIARDSLYFENGELKTELIDNAN